MKWLFLVHQVQTPNSRERVKVWRLTKKVGAVLYRNSVYLLPYSKENLESFQWLCQQIKDSKGEASVFVTESQDESENTDMKSLFNQIREAEFREILKAAESVHKRIRSVKRGKRIAAKEKKSLGKEIARLEGLFTEIERIDFFEAPQRGRTRAMIDGAKNEFAALGAFQEDETPVRDYNSKDFEGKLWCTREHIHIDRLCSAWLIRTFIDRKATFAFSPETNLPKEGIPFDVFGAEFSHRGEDCTFETLLKAFRIHDKALESMAQIIHDIDLKDNKFGRPEAPGLDLIVRALSEALNNDQRVLEVGSTILNSVYSRLKKRKVSG